MRLLPTLIFLFPCAAVAGVACIEAPYLSAGSDAQSKLAKIYEDVAFALDRFPSLGAAMADKSPELCFSGRMDNAHAYLDADQNRIYIDPKLPAALQVGVLLHEIRHLNQIVFGSCPSDELAMEEYASATYALEADASAVSLLVTWDMKENGNDKPWLALSSWEAQADIASRFDAEMVATGDAAFAVSAAFDQWYASDARREAYYLAACSDYLDRQDASKALPQYQLVPVEFFDYLCRLPNGTRYQCSHPDIDQR